MRNGKDQARGVDGGKKSEWEMRRTGLDGRWGKKLNWKCEGPRQQGGGPTIV